MKGLIDSFCPKDIRERTRKESTIPILIRWVRY
jgi:hypothetical protein